MDLPFSDPHLDRRYSDVSNYVEQTVRLRWLLVLSAGGEAPDIAPAPMHSNGS